VRVIRQEVRTFSTITKSLYELAEWLLAEQVMAVAMEATGVYWKPVWHVLEASGLSLVLANAAHIKAVPGRKTDVNDAMWIADLLAHGRVGPDAEHLHGAARPAALDGVALDLQTTHDPPPGLRGD
jgi:transposase